MGRMLLLLCESPFQKLNDHRVYAPQSYIEKRRMRAWVSENLKLFDVNTMIDLLFSDKTVINL
jgi:hypothetical protein